MIYLQSVSPNKKWGQHSCCKKTDYPIAYFARFYLLPEPPVVGRRSSTITDRLAKPLTQLPATVVITLGLLLVGSLCSLLSSPPPGTIRILRSWCLSLVRQLAVTKSWRTLRPGSSVSRSYREVVIRKSFIQLSRYSCGISPLQDHLNKISPCSHFAEVIRYNKKIRFSLYSC